MPLQSFYYFDEKVLDNSSQARRQNPSSFPAEPDWLRSTVQRYVVAYKLCVGVILQRGKSNEKTEFFLTDTPRSGMMG